MLHNSRNYVHAVAKTNNSISYITRSQAKVPHYEPHFVLRDDNDLGVISYLPNEHSLPTMQGRSRYFSLSLSLYFSQIVMRRISLD